MICYPISFVNGIPEYLYHFIDSGEDNRIVTKKTLIYHFKRSMKVI